jgi:asparagine synthase (glutamine-hydrolysing)
MCGIFGKVAADGVQRETLERMATVLRHRGPDDVGHYLADNVGLGNRRLSIIDLQGGHQPITNEERSLWLVYNGEIYNYAELRRQLEAQGHRFGSDTDTEVIVHLYEEQGPDCVHRLEGMFAFAVWDVRRKRLFLARDRLGQKPLYYHHRPGLFLFASEMKAILEDAGVSAAVDVTAMHDYLSLRFVPPPRTMFQGICKLPAAHTLLLEDGELRVERYWSLSYEPKLRISEAEALDTLDDLLGRAVESHLVADVPVGALLSGGLDSGLVVALLRTRTRRRPFTFSVGVTEEDWSELPFARAVAERYDTEHHETVVRPDLLSILPRLVWHLDEPSDPSAACKYYVAQAAARHVKVALGGDGGDEMMGGYDRYVGNRLMRYYCLLPRGLRRQISRRLTAWVPDSFAYKSLAQKLRWLDQLATDGEDQRYAASVNFFRFDEATKRRFYTSRVEAQIARAESLDYIASVFQQAPLEDLVDRMLYTDVMTQLPEHGCMIVDRTSMAFSIESRSPFLDRQVAEFSAALPSSLKVRGHRIRYLQRRLARRYLPREVAGRRKQGFGLPLGYWFKQTLGEVTADLFSRSALAEDGYLERDGLLSVLDDHRSRGIDHSHRLWILLNLEVWYRIFIRGEQLTSLGAQPAAGGAAAASTSAGAGPAP